MKIWILLLSILAMAGTWRWAAYKNAKRSVAFSQQINIIIKSLLAGIIVYFSLLLIAIIYMAITS